MNFRYEHIARKLISRDNRFSLHPFLDSELVSAPLLSSIRTAGILTPPTVLPRDGIFACVCGRQRLHCAELTGPEEQSCLCRVLPESQPAEVLLAVILEDQAAGGPLSLLEQSCFLALCDTLLADQRRKESFLAGLPPGRLTKGTRFLRRLSAMDRQIQRHIHQGLLSEKIAADLQKLPVAEQRCFAGLVEDLGIGGNRQKILLSQLIDLCRRARVSLPTLLRQTGLDRHSPRDLPAPQRAKLFIDEVEQLHLPRQSRARKDFAHRTARLQLPETCALLPSPSFERDEVTLSIRFATLEDLELRWDRLRSALADDSSEA